MLPEMRKPSETYFLNLPNGSGICILDASFQEEIIGLVEKNLEEGCIRNIKNKNKYKSQSDPVVLTKVEVRNQIRS